MIGGRSGWVARQAAKSVYKYKGIKQCESKEPKNAFAIQNYHSSEELTTIFTLLGLPALPEVCSSRGSTASALPVSTSHRSGILPSEIYQPKV